MVDYNFITHLPTNDIPNHIPWCSDFQPHFDAEIHRIFIAIPGYQEGAHGSSGRKRRNSGRSGRWSGFGTSADEKMSMKRVMVHLGDVRKINGNSRILKFRYLPRPMEGLCKGIYSPKIWPYIVQYLHFRILNFPLKKNPKKQGVLPPWKSFFPVCMVCGQHWKTLLVVLVVD